MHHQAPASPGDAMTTDLFQTAREEELRRLAPEIDPGGIDRSVDLREEIDIDSMDFLNLATALSSALT
jgi:acyl carrier protein